jgi:hypothetical protein
MMEGHENPLFDLHLKPTNDFSFVGSFKVGIDLDQL